MDIKEDLLVLENKFLSSDYKFGILYAKKDQNENQMFSNCKCPLKVYQDFINLNLIAQYIVEEGVSAQFHKFLNLLGGKVTLKGFKGYSGGLDVKSTYYSKALSCLHNKIVKRGLIALSLLSLPPPHQTTARESTQFTQNSEISV